MNRDSELKVILRTIYFRAEGFSEDKDNSYSGPIKVEWPQGLWNTNRGISRTL